MHITQRMTIQLVTDFTLRQRREYWRNTWTRGVIKEDLWRDAIFHIGADGVKVELGSRNESGGYLAGHVKRFVAWEDLDDKENLRNIFTNEEPIVVREVMAKLEELREARLDMRRALSSTFAQPVRHIAVPA